MLGDPEAGVEWITKAMRLDPYRPDLFGNNLGIALFSAKRYQEALSALQHITTVRYPHNAFMAACYAALGKPEEAKAQIDKVLKAKPDFSAAAFAATVPYRLESDRDHLRDRLRQAGSPD